MTMIYATKWTLHTEWMSDENTIEVIFPILDELLDGYTATRAEGVWNGNHEQSLVIEIIQELSGHNSRTIETAARRICRANNQDAVMVTSEHVNMRLVKQSSEIVARELGHPSRSDFAEEEAEDIKRDELTREALALRAIS